VNNIEANPEELGLGGSPTKVKKVDSIVFQSKESRTLDDFDEDIDGLMKELIDAHIIG
jgi:electron transfer flavoprotein beta subunit